MFWDIFNNLCRQRGKSPTSVAKDLSIAAGTVSEWKKGRQPQNSTLLKVADYFGVQPTDLLNQSASTPSDTPKPVKPDTAGTPVEKKGYSPPGTFGAGISPEEVEELSEGFSPVQKELFRTVLALDNKDAAKAIQLIQLILERDNGGK